MSMSYWLSLLLWQEVTYLTANTAHSFFPSEWWLISLFLLHFRIWASFFPQIFGKNSSLIFLEFWHCVWKCNSVITVTAQLILFGQPEMPVSAILYWQTMITQFVHCQCLSLLLWLDCLPQYTVCLGSQYVSTLCFECVIPFQ